MFANSHFSELVYLCTSSKTLSLCIGCRLLLDSGRKSREIMSGSLKEWLAKMLLFVICTRGETSASVVEDWPVGRAGSQGWDANGGALWSSGDAFGCKLWNTVLKRWGNVSSQEWQVIQSVWKIRKRMFRHQDIGIGRKACCSKLQTYLRGTNWAGTLVVWCIQTLQDGCCSFDLVFCTIQEHELGRRDIVPMVE